ASLNINASYSLISGSSLQIGASSGTVAINNSSTVNLNTPLAANANPLTLSGSGTLIINVASSRTGSTTMTSETVRPANAAGLGSGTVHIGTGAFLELVGGTNFGAPATFDGNSGMRAFNGFAVYSGTLTVATSTTVKLNGGALSTDTLRVGNVAPNVYTGGA